MACDVPDSASPSSADALALAPSRDFARWLAATGGSLAFTTYQAGKLFLIGTKRDGGLSVFERSFERAMGLAADGDGHSLALATQYQIQRFDDVLPAGGTTPDGYDALYAPHAAWVTGDLDVHDMAFGVDGRPMFVNTLFNCVATVSDGHSFRPLWKPPFVSGLAAEDRCHLNGLAAEDGVPRYVTAVSQSDVADGWRERRGDGGVVIDVASSEIVAAGLSMPHSPRMYGGELWMLNSGAGEFGRVDRATGRFEAIAFCPGYARGLAFVGAHAVIGLSLARGDRTFAGLALDDALVQRDAEPRCGLVVIDLKSGDLVHWMWIDGPVRELYDVALLPGVTRPSAIGFRTDEVKQVISVENAA